MDNNQFKILESIAGGTPELPIRRRPSLRLKRIDDYRRAVLDIPDPLTANLGAINSDLMMIAFQLQKVTKAAFVRSSGVQANLGALLPAIDAQARIARQIQRLAELECRLRASQGTKPPPHPGEKNGT